MNYTILDSEKLPEALKNKPKWLTYLIVATGILMITVSAILIGVFIGYTYCYIEHQNRMAADSNSASTKFEFVQLPVFESEDVKNRRFINGALASSFLVSRILKLGHAFFEEKSSSPSPEKKATDF